MTNIFYTSDVYNKFLPYDGLYILPKIFNKVDFPAPFSPLINVNPFLISNEISLSIILLDRYNLIFLYR